jgi:hypothetical protein
MVLGWTVEALEYGAEEGAGGVGGIGEIDDLHSHLSEASLVVTPEQAPLPVVSDDGDVEMVFLPCQPTVHGALWDHFVDAPECADDGGPFGVRDDGDLVLVSGAQLVCGNPDDQPVAALSGFGEKLEVSDMKQVEHACGVSRYWHLSHPFRRPLVLGRRCGAWKREP